MKSYVITGASSGIGKALAEMLQKEGNRVFNIDLKNGDFNGDLSSPAGRAAAVEAVHAAFPDGLDGLVCCAGVPGTCPSVKLIMSLNFYGAAAIAEGCFDLLKKKKGHCVLISTFALAEGFPMPQAILKLAANPGSEEAVLKLIDETQPAPKGEVMYNVAKYCLTLWMRRHAPMWGAGGVHINCVAPGTTNTAMVAGLTEKATAMLSALPMPTKYPAVPMLEAGEVANVIRFLLMPESSAIHGSLIFADGGADTVLNTERVY